MNTYTCFLCQLIDTTCSCPEIQSTVPEDAKLNGAPPWNSGRMGYSLHSPESKEKISNRLKNKKKSDLHKKRMSDSAIKRGKWNKRPEAVKRTIETTLARRKEGLINPYSKERNSKMAASKTGTKRVYREDGTFFYVRAQEHQ
jgi:hypothetical protein